MTAAFDYVSDVAGPGKARLGKRSKLRPAISNRQDALHLKARLSEIQQKAETHACRLQVVHAPSAMDIVERPDRFRSTSEEARPERVESCHSAAQ